MKLIVTGRTRTLKPENIPINIRDYFIFKLMIPYDEMYLEIEKSDYIIITLDPNNSYDYQFKTIRVTGSMQLSLGFLKPVLINEVFADFYFLNSENSLIFNNSNFCDIMKKSILLNKIDYKKLQNKLNIHAKDVYQKSINNVKRFVPEI